MIVPARARRLLSALVLVLLLAVAPSAAQTPVLTILHFNDDYQLAAVDGGKAGGLDRLAVVVKQYRGRERPTLLLFAGDLISPSVESSVFKGAQLKRSQPPGCGRRHPRQPRVRLRPDELEDRIVESRFPWVASNTFASGLRPFPGTRHFLLLNAGGVTIGIIGLLTEETATSSSPAGRAGDRPGHRWA